MLSLGSSMSARFSIVRSRALWSSHSIALRWRSVNEAPKLGGLTETAKAALRDHDSRAKCRRAATIASRLAEKLLELSPHHRRIDVDTGPIFDADHALIDQHAEPVDHGAAARLC